MQRRGTSQCGIASQHRIDLRRQARYGYSTPPRSAACEFALNASNPGDINGMTAQEVRDGVHRLYRDDLPYATYIKGITQTADAAWAKLSEAERSRYEVDVYGRLMDAERLLTGDTARSRRRWSEIRSRGRHFNGA